MFYSDVVLSRRGDLGKVWLAAHTERKLTKSQFLSADLEECISTIAKQDAGPMSLRISFKARPRLGHKTSSATLRLHTWPTLLLGLIHFDTPPLASGAQPIISSMPMIIRQALATSTTSATAWELDVLFLQSRTTPPVCSPSL